MEVLDENYKPERDQSLMAEAKRRVGFKWQVMVYIVVNAMFWVIWMLTGADYPWPIWPAIGWGIGIFFSYLSVYKKNDLFSVDKEYESLKRRQ